MKRAKNDKINVAGNRLVNIHVALKMQCLFFYLLISFTNAKYKQNCSFNKLVRFFLSANIVQYEHATLTQISTPFFLC